MRIWELITNEGKAFYRIEPTRKQMFSYIRKKMAEGYRLSEIIFCWGPVNVNHRAPYPEDEWPRKESHHANGS